MAKMIAMKGLPACGKTTAAELIMAKTGNFVRINKDSLRKMLHFDKFTGHNESLTRDAARALAKVYLGSGTNVIIDDTNLNPGTMESWRTLAGELGAKFEVVDMTDVPVEVCVMRDADRPDSVGGTVIKNMALRYGLRPIPDKGFVIVDIDGTLADVKHRLHYLESNPKDWKGFFGHSGEDPLRKDVAKIAIDYYNKGHTIIYVSARPEEYREETLKWLNENSVGFGWTLIMRRSGDKRPDTETKQDIYEKYLKGFPIEVVIDDRPRVIAMWRANGLNVLDVGEGVDF